MAGKPTYEELEQRTREFEIEVNKLKAAVEILTDGEDNNANMLKEFPYPLLIMCSDTSIKYVNIMFERLTGYSSEEVIGLKAPYPWWIIGDPRSCTVAKRKKYMFKEVRNIEKIFHKKNGEEFWVQINTVPIGRHDGKMKYSLIHWFDISERKKVEETLRESGARYRTLVNTAPYGIQLTDLDGKIVFSNPAHHKLQGYDEDELVGKFIWDLIADDADKSEAKEHYKNLVKKQPPPKIYITRNKTKDGRLIDVKIDWDYIFDSKGEIERIISIISDVTKRKQEKKSLQKAHNKLERQVQERTEELKIKASNLEEMNAALRVLLEQRKTDKAEIEEKILRNVRELFEPYIKKLKNNQLTCQQSSLLDILESNLNDIVSPFASCLSNLHLNLTHGEIQVANLVKQGKSSKEIGALLNLSKRTIDTHRDNIRKKLGIRNKKTNLRTYLLSIQ